MGQSYFVWNGVDCRSMGLIMRGPAPIIRPEERVNHVEIPGRSGDLTETQGENIYNSYIQTVSFAVRGGSRVREVYKWLRGAGYVTFSGEPDRKQKARVIGAITLTRHGHNLDYWEGEAQIYCQPLKELLNEPKVTITGSATVMNNGDVECAPLWKVTATGNVTLSAGGNTLTLTTGSGTVWIDSDTMEIFNSDKTATLTADSAGDFPVLQPGANTVSGGGWSKIEIEKRERFL